MLKIYRSSFNIGKKCLPNINYLNLQTLQTRNFSKQEEKQSKQEQLEAEFKRRKMEMEKREIEELKKKVEKTSSSFTIGGDFLRIIRGKLIFGLFIVGSIFGGYQFYTLTDFAYDPFDNKKKLVYLKYHDELLIANAISALLTQSYSPINHKSIMFDKMKKAIDEIKDKEELKSLNLKLNSNITILDIKDNVFLVLPNGNIFISLPVLEIFDDVNKFLVMTAMEVSHNYLRTNAYNISLNDLYSLWKLRAQNFNIGKVHNLFDFNVLRQISFLPINKREQEDKMIRLLPEIIERMGAKIENPEVILGGIIQKVAEKDAKLQIKSPKIESILSRHWQLASV